jgi:hypothetical protein
MYSTSNYQRLMAASKQYSYRLVSKRSYMLHRKFRLTIKGGNDAGLVDILNQCIFQWASFNKEQATVGKVEELKQKLEGNKDTNRWAQGIDWDKLSLGCDGQLSATQAVIDSKAFNDTLDRVIEAAKSKLSSELV